MNVTPAYYLYSTGFCNCQVKFHHVYDYDYDYEIDLFGHIIKKHNKGHKQ